MSNNSLKYNQTYPCLATLRDHNVMHTRGGSATVAATSSGFARYIVRVCGVLIFFELMGVVAAEGASLSLYDPNRLVRTGVAQDNSLKMNVSRRDPFKRIPQLRPSTPKVTPPPHQEAEIAPPVNNPGWRLLGVMHAQDGPQAVIQVSPTERILVKPGSELARSGWTVKTIEGEEVLLEHLSPSSSVGKAFPTRTFILSFPAIQSSP
ncbi:MAG: hypothetical protein KC592_08690 [Nitrospira sp.]|nr:hypothetical protein [Nitrospira sp.]